MASAKASVEIQAPPKAVWEIIRDFNALPTFAPGVKESTTDGEGVGAVRTVQTADGRTIKEKLEKHDDQAMALCYSIVEPPMPFENYRATMVVLPKGERSCEVQWGSTFQPTQAPEAELVANFEKMYGSGLNGLKAYCESA